MRFDFTLIFTFLFVSAVLADHSLEHRSSQFLDVVEKRTSATDVAGAVLYTSTSSFHGITGTIVVPDVWGSIDSGVVLSVGLNNGPDSSCGRVAFEIRFICTLNSDGPVYEVVASWYPDYWKEFTDVKVSPGDSIKVIVTVSDEKTGLATIQKLGDGTNEQTLPVKSNYPLCQSNAGWLVEKMDYRDLAHFSFVLFTQPMVYGDDNYTAGGSSVYDITKDGQALTTVQAYGNLIQVVENYVQ